jgi:1-acyl-sn-glycerol-3-phosphate acyltransferase
MQALRAGWLLFLFLLLTLILIPIQALARSLRLPLRKAIPHFYHGLVARLFGIRISTRGKPVTDEGVLLVATHTSWLDIVIFSAVTRVSFVAKSEVAGWAFFGLLAKLQETVFVTRQRRSATGEARDKIRERLLAGDALILFPEGTSNDGNRVKPFKSALMGAAAAEMENGRHVRVQPVSTAYVRLYGMPMGRENRPFFAWYGDMDLVPHLWEALKTGPIDVVVEFHEPLSLDVMDRKQLAQAAEGLVRRGQAMALAGIEEKAAQKAA